MSFTLIKRQLLVWGFTFVALVLLLGSGLLIGVWFEYSEANTFDHRATTPAYLSWRLLVYGLLLLFWSVIIKRVLPSMPRGKQSAVGRRVLLLLIIAYELLIVQNPLAQLLQRLS